MRGSVVQRGKTWSYVVDVGRDPASGRRRQKWKGGFATKREAEQALARALTGEVATPGSVTVGAFLDQWPAGQFEQSQIASLRDSLLGGWIDERGNTDPFIDGVEFESIEPIGRFPDAHIVARCRAANRAGILFGRRWNLYDDLGNPQELEYADMHLIEDIEAAGWGLPPMEECRPDDDGLVWF